jgi:hypothetical protein
MAKRKKVLPARKRQRDRSRDDESLLMRSAETLGRMIGTLQRQLDGATKRLSKTADDIIEVVPDAPVKRRRTSSKRKTAAKGTTGATRKRAATRSAKKR